VIAETFILILAGLAGYAALVLFAVDYGRRTGWQTPEGTDANDWAMRQRVGITLGGLAVVVCAIGCGILMTNWLTRGLVLAQAAVMAAAGASDLRRFHLPLPLSVLGIALAVASLVIMRISPLMLAFALAWALAVIVLHALLSRGSMQLGDHIATIWIALAMPFNGMFAVVLGDFANVILVKAKGLRGKKVAAAGAWLLFAAALVALPPYVAWFTNRQSQQTASDSGTVASAYVQTLAPDLPLVAMVPQVGASHPHAPTLVVLLDLAGDHTASVALEETREGRVTKAGEAAVQVAHLAGYARQLGATAKTVDALVWLSQALANYDLAGVRGATAQIAQERAALSKLALAQSQSQRMS
jgi:hypothetical protein